jgi:hypothetical protein
MNRLLFSLLAGILSAALDTVPMLVRKLPRASVLSAGIECLVVAILVFHLSTGLPDWLGGMLASVLCAAPIVVLVGSSDAASVIPIILTQAALGALDGLSLSFLVARNWV